MPNDRLALWMNERYARDAVGRGLSKSPKGRSKDRSVRLAALGSLTRYNTIQRHVFLGMDTLAKTSSPRLTMRADFSYRELELAVTQTVCNNRT